MSKTHEKYVVISGNPTWFASPYTVTTYRSIDAAISAYNEARRTSGDDVRLARIVLDYGEEV